jgi:plastocyanin
MLPPVARARLVAVVAFAGLGLAACGGGRPGVSPQAAGASEAATVSGGVQHLTVHAGSDLRFAQTALTAHPGKVELTLQVTGSTPHDLMFSDGPTGGTPTVQNGSSQVTLTFSTPGTYHFLCTIHPQMTGTLAIS